MTALTQTRRPGAGTVFGAVIGLFLGVLVGALAIPRHQTVTTTGAGTGALGAGSGPGAAGALGTPSGGGGPAPGSATGGAGGGTGSAAITGYALGPSSGAAAGTQTAAGPTSAAALARGVSANTIKIGVAYADLTALRALGPEYDNGNVPQQWQAVLDWWHRQGLVPVNGRDIQLYYSKYDVIDLSAQRASCASMIQDDGVFAVVGVSYFSVGSDCVASEYHTPMLTSDGPGADVFARGAPYLFSIDESADRTLDNMLYWADGRGTLRGHKIGLYYANDGIEPQLVDRSIRPTLAHLGYKLATEATTSPQDTNGGPEDAVAVQKFRAAGVEVAILLTSKTGFLQAASAQGYKPTFIESDFLYGTSDVTTAPYPAQEFDGTYAITTSYRGAPAAGQPLTSGQKACIENYERYSGTKVDRPGPGKKETAVYAYTLEACDEGGVMLDAIRSAGRNLTASALIAGLDAIRNKALLRWAAMTFTPARYDGADLGRALLWKASCTCYVAQGTFSPLTLR